MSEPEPVLVRKKAIDVVPQFHGIYYTVDGGKPFVNTIELRNWSEDGTEIEFMLGSFNFDFRRPDEEMTVVELTPSQYCNLDKVRADDVEFRKKQPMGDEEFGRLWAL